MVMDLQEASGDEAAQKEVVRTYETFVERVEELQLHERAFEKPRLDVSASKPRTQVQQLKYVLCLYRASRSLPCLDSHQES